MLLALPRCSCTGLEMWFPEMKMLHGKRYGKKHGKRYGKRHGKKYGKRHGKRYGKTCAAIEGDQSEFLTLGKNPKASLIFGESS